MSRILLLITMLITAGCTGLPSSKTSRPPLQDRGEYKVDTSFPSQSQDNRVKFLIMHYTAVDDAESLRLLTQGSVSAHYLVPEHPRQEGGKPVVLQLVDEQARAWHAGVSNWLTRNNLNDTSIGIEIVNPGFTEGTWGKKWYPYNEQQIVLIERLSQDIIKRNNIAPENVLAHSDIAPLRKTDPGPLFPWKRLADKGIGAWPDDSTVQRYLAGRNKQAPASVATLQQTLAKYGYKIPQTGNLDTETKTVISAFQMHFRPADFSGTPDAETEAIALALVEKYKS